MLSKATLVLHRMDGSKSPQLALSVRQSLQVVREFRFIGTKQCDILTTLHVAAQLPTCLYVDHMRHQRQNIPTKLTTPPSVLQLPFIPF